MEQRHDFEQVCKSPFVQEISTKEEEIEVTTKKSKRLNINQKIITSPHVMVEINTEVSRFERFNHLLLRKLEGDYQTNAQKIIESTYNGCRFLSKLHPFITASDRLVYFD